MENITKIKNNIYKLYFHIIKEVQYIEKNLANAIATTTYLLNYRSNKESIDLLVEKIYKEISFKSLGFVIAKAQDNNLFKNKNEYIILQEILEFRNMLIHSFFKDNNFELADKNNDYNFYLDKFNLLDKKFTLIWNFNLILCDIVKDKRIELLKILKK